MPMDSHMCFEYSMQKNNTIEIEKNLICPDPPPCVGGFGHGWGAFRHN